MGFSENYLALRKKKKEQAETGTSKEKPTGGTTFTDRYLTLREQGENGLTGLSLPTMTAGPSKQTAYRPPQTMSEAIADQWRARAAEEKAAEDAATGIQNRSPAWAREMADRYRPKSGSGPLSPVAQYEAEKQAAAKKRADGQTEKKPSAGDWASLAGNTLLAGVGQVSKASSSLFSAAEQLVSRPLGWLLGNPELYKDAPLYQLDKAVDQDVAAVQENLAGSAEKTGKAGELIAKFGPATVAALPQAALAYLTAGQSMAAQGTTAGLQAASTAAQLTGGAAVANTVAQGVKAMAANPSFQYSFLNTAGGEYQQALEDGADWKTAYAYAALSSLANSMVEVGGGIDTLPEAVRGKSKGQLLEWVKSMFDEGKEEVVQGAISQMMQNGAYQKGNPLFSMTDENAVVNPGRMAEEFAGGAVVGGVLGGGQMVINAAIDSAARKAAQRDVQAQAEQGDTRIPEQAQTGMEARGNVGVEPAGPAEAQKNTATGADQKGKTIVEHLRGNAKALVEMEPVARLIGTELPKQGRATDRAMAFLQKIGNKVNRPGFGDVLFSRAKVKTALVGHGTSEAKIETIAAVPEVIKNGQLLNQIENYNGRGYDTFVFGAPVTYKDRTVLVGAVVAKDKITGRYYVHEVVDSDGNILLDSKEPEGNSDRPPNMDGPVIPSGSIAEDAPTAIKTGVTAESGITGTAGAPADTADAASTDIVQQKNADVNGVNSVESTGSSAEQMTGRLVRMGEQAETAARIGELLGRVKDGQTLTEAELNEVRSNPSGAKLIDAVQEIAARRAAEDTMGGQNVETETGSYLPDGQKERGIGADPGGQAETVSESAEGWDAEGQRGGAAADDGKIPVSVREETIPDRASGTQSLRAIARQNAVTESGAEMVSTKNYMGLDIGSDRPSLFDAPEEVIRSDKVLSEVYDTIWEEGYRPHMFTGSPELADANLVFDGAVNGEDVYIRIDQGRYDADAIWEHERFHILSAEDPGLRSSVRDALLQQYDQAELMKIMETYLEKYRGAYGMETVQGLWDLSEADMDLILEELLADAYAGKDTFRTGTGKYRDTVREIASRREEQGYRTGGAPEAARFDVGYSQDGKRTTGTEEPAGLSLPTLEDSGKNAKTPAEEDTGQRAAPAERRKAASRKLADDLAEIFPETSKKYLRDLADEIRSGAEQEQLDALFNEAYDSARVYDESPEAAELREIAKELRGRRVYVDESVREAFDDDWKSMRGFFMGKGLYFTGDRNDIGLDVLNGELASRFGGRFNEGETDLENVVSRLEYVLRAGAAKQITLDEQARQYGGEEAVQKFREAYRQRFMDAAEGYRDTMSGIAEDQRKAREDARRRKRQELEDYLEEARRTLRDRASQGKDTGRTDPRTHVPEGVTIDEYVQSLEQRAAQAREERLRDLQREDFRGSEAMEKLGVKIAGAVTEDYQNAPELRRRQEAAEKARRAVRRAEKRMNATEAEKEFAAGITSGIYTESDIPRTMDADRVMELADYYMGERAFGFDMLRQRKADISRAQQEKAKEIFGPALEAGEGKRKLAGGVMGALGDAFALNNRTAERNMRAIFGDEAGDRINRWLFAPVAENEGERYRFVNRMLDQVREIKGADGKKRKLTKAESALVQKTIEGRAAAEAVASMEMGESIRNAAQKLNEGGDMKDVAREFRLNEENRRLARQYAMWLETQEEIKSADGVKIDNAVKIYSDLYGQFYEAINDFLAVHGYEPIGFIKGYAPHMQSKETVGALNRAFQSLGLGADAGGLPTAIAGLTKDFKPGKRWSPFFQTRRGEATDYDITEGFERYVDHLSDVLYHTDDITRIREANKFLRKMYDQEEINERISQARELRYRTTKEKRDFLVDQGELDPRRKLTADEIEKRMDEYSARLYENVRNTSRYGQLAVWLDDYANMLAGKQVFADRDMERSFGRTSLNLGNKLTRAFTRAQVSGNLSSVLNQTSQLPLIQAEVGDKYLRHAMLDMVTGGLRKGDWALKSDFLTEKNGIDYITTSPSDMIVGAMFKPMGFVDGFLSTLAVRGRYLKEIDAGRSETEAMRIADRYGREVMGSRAKGSAPLAFQSKNVFNRMIHAFQLEALNTWEHISQDLPRDYRAIAKDKGKNAAARALAGTVMKILVGNFLLNRASEMLYGGTPAQGDVFGIIGNFVASGAGTTLNAFTISALKKVINAGWEKVMGEKLFDDDDEEDEEERPFDLLEAAKSAGSDVLNDTPLAKNAGALFGVGDLSLPMPDLVKGVQRTADAAKEDGLFSHEVMRQLMGLAGDVVPGGRQAEKTFQGLDTALRGGRFSGYGEKEKLMYPVDEDPFTALRAALFGNSALEETGEYYASGNKALSEEQTKVYKAAVDAGGGRKEIYNAILDWRNVNGDEELTSEEKARLGEEIVGETDLSDREKLKFYKGLTGADSRAGKLEALLNAGMDWDGAIGAYAMYDEIKRREGMTAGEKATAFARWADETYPAKQAGAVREQFVYYSMVPAQAGRYDKLTGAGLGTDTAYRLSETLGALEPEPGKNQVSNMQKYQAIVSAGLSEGDQLKAMEAVMSEGEYAKVKAGYEQGVTPELYVKARETAAGYDENGNGSISQDEAKRAIKSMDGITSEQRAALWQIQNKSWKPDNNPFNKKVGREVYQELNREEPEEDEEDGSQLTGLRLPSLQ